MDNKYPKYIHDQPLPTYGAHNQVTPMEREQRAVEQQQKEHNSSRYPGVVGGTPAEFRGIQGYDSQGNPIIPPFIAQRHQIEERLGPTCQHDGGYHDLRMHLTYKSLLFAILVVPYCCGYRGKRVVSRIVFWTCLFIMVRIVRVSKMLSKISKYCSSISINKMKGIVLSNFFL